MEKVYNRLPAKTSSANGLSGCTVHLGDRTWQPKGGDHLPQAGIRTLTKFPL
jgi:hypothetical protein